MGLRPLPQQLLTAAKLRRQAKELILLAEELEATVPEPAMPKREVEFAFSKKNRSERK